MEEMKHNSKSQTEFRVIPPCLFQAHRVQVGNFFLTLQVQPAVEINSVVEMEDAFLEVGSVMATRIVVMEVMK